MKKKSPVRGATRLFFVSTGGAPYGPKNLKISGHLHVFYVSATQKINDDDENTNIIDKYVF
jgi:hypothetical protein